MEAVSERILAMRDGLQELGGEVARLRHECSFLMRALDELERLSFTVKDPTESENTEVHRANRNYAWSARENLERATGDLKNWHNAVEDAIARCLGW